MAKHKYTLQVRTRGQAYRTVETSTDAREIGWAFRQFLSPEERYAARILQNGKLWARAVPKAWTGRAGE